MVSCLSAHFAFCILDDSRLPSMQARLQSKSDTNSMKLIATLAAISTLFAATHAAECDMKLNAAVATTAREKCEDTSSFDFGLSTPSAEIVAKFCKTEACMTVLQDVKSLGLPECTIYGKQLYKDVLDPLEKACKQSTGGTASSSKTSANNTTSGQGSKLSNASDTASAVKVPRNTSASTPAPSSLATTSALSTSLSAAAVLSIALALV